MFVVKSAVGTKRPVSPARPDYQIKGPWSLESFGRRPPNGADNDLSRLKKSS